MKKGVKIFQLIFTSMMLLFSPIANVFAEGGRIANEEKIAIGSLGMDGAVVGDGSKVQVVAGGLEEAGDVQVTKIVEKTETLGKYKVSFNVKGKPVKKETTVEKPVYAVVVFDRSSSMRSYGNETKWNNAKDGAKLFASTLKANISGANMALIGFDRSASTLRDFSTNNFNSVDFGTTSQGTNLGGGLALANQLLSDIDVPDAVKYVVVISDGEPSCWLNSDGTIGGISSGTNADNYAYSEAGKVKANGFEIFSIGYSVGVNSHAENVLKTVASKPENYFAADPAAVAAAFNNIAEEISKINAGSNATLTDGIGSNFKLTAADNYGGTKTLNIGDITEEGVTTEPFYIEIDKSLETGWYDTNAGFSLTYTDANGRSREIESKENPQVYWAKYDYKTEYYYNGIKDESKTETGRGVEGTSVSNYTKKEEIGYKFEKVENLPLVISSDESENIIKVFYVTDETQTERVHYIVEYYKDDELQTGDTEVVTGSVHVLANKEIAFIKGLVDEDKYEGYSFKGTNPAVIPDMVASGTVIKVYYTANSFKYFIEHIEKDTSNRLGMNSDFANFGATITVEKEDFTGFKYDSQDKNKIVISFDEEKNTATVYYVREVYEYTIKYVEEGNEENILDEMRGEASFENEIVAEEKAFDGFTLRRKSPEDGKIKISEDEERNVITLYYEKDGLGEEDEPTGEESVEEDSVDEQKPTEQILPPHTGVSGIDYSLLIISVYLVSVFVALKSVIKRD